MRFFCYFFAAALIFNGLCQGDICEEVNLQDIEFRDEGMFLVNEEAEEVEISALFNDGNGYYARYDFEYVCEACDARFRTHPGACRKCGSADILKKEVECLAAVSTL